MSQSKGELQLPSLLLNHLGKPRKEVRSMKTVAEVDSRIKKTLRDLEFFSLFELDELYEIRLHPTFPTACWRWDKRERKHKILIGLGGKLEERFKKHPEYMKSFGYHELSHSLHTERNMEKIKEVLDKEGIPFQLYNLFEDARIEHLWRKKFGRRFDWVRYEERDIDQKMRVWFRDIAFNLHLVRQWKETGYAEVHPVPEEVFLWIIQYEGDPIKLLRIIPKAYCDSHVDLEIGDRIKGFDIETGTGFREYEDYEELVGALLNRIYEYYRRAISATSFEEMVEVMKDWIEEFGKLSPQGYPQLLPTSNSEGNGEGDYSEMEVSLPDPDDTDEDTFSQLWEEAKEFSGNKEDREDREDTEEEAYGLGEKGDTEYKEPEGDRIVPSGRYTSVDWSRVEREVQKLLRVFRSYTKKADTTSPSKRLNPKKLALDRDDIYRKEEELSFKMLPFTILVDCSGSMCAMTPEQHILTAICSELAGKTGTQAFVIFTRNHEAQLFKLPMKREDIERIPYDGWSENILGGLKKFERYILRTKFLFVISDMEITDYWTRTQEKIHQLRRKGIEVIGIYRGKYYNEAKKNAPQFFDRYVVTEETNPIDLLIPVLRAVVRV